jgi:toxin CcdB
MAQFDVYVNPTPGARASFPYLVELQSAQLERLPTRLVMPLQRLARAPAGMPRRLAQMIDVHGESLYLAAHQCAALPATALRTPVGSALPHRAAIIDALDAVVSGV